MFFSSKPISKDGDVVRAQSPHRWFNGHVRGVILWVCGLCALVQAPLAPSAHAQSDQRSITPLPSSADRDTVPESKPEAQPHKDPAPAPQAEGDEGAEKNGAAKKTVSSLILTVKLALLADPRLFPYEIEVEASSNDVTLLGKVPTDMEKSIAAEVARAVPVVKSVVNKIEMAKDLPEVLARRQDDLITRNVKERFSKSATVTAANFDVKTEQGVVSLSGAVRFQVIVLEAAEAARHVLGVKAVKTEKVRIESEG